MSHTRLLDHHLMHAARNSFHLPTFRQAVAGDAELADAARAKLAEITDDMTQRCHITRRTRDHLRHALGDS